MSHGPIDDEYRAQMRAVAETVDEVFNPPGLPGLARPPKTTGFVLLVFPFGDADSGRINYISNGDRADVVTAMKELIARFEGRMPETPGTPQ